MLLSCYNVGPIGNTTLIMFTVSDVDECNEENLIPGCVISATCMNVDGNFTCTCPTGFTGDGRESGSGCTGMNV